MTESAELEGATKNGAASESLDTEVSIWDAVAASAALETPSTPPAEAALKTPVRSVAAPTLVGIAPEVAALTHAARMHGVLTPGSTFGVYVVGAPIGEGGMARIYRAEHAGLRRQVALKVLINGFAKDPEGRERFVREARIAAAIKHPNVVNIFDVGVHEDIPYLVMELLEGTDLETLVESKGALEESQILDIMVPVVAGLTAVHDAGIVHRDLKPGNIFLAKGRYDELEPKLLDFGISKAAGPDQLRLTTHGLLMGTPFYMSPEGLRGDEMTPLSDQYSLGVLMYECATGRGPFVASTLPELVRVISSGEYPPPNQHKPELSKRLTRIILRAMSLDPAQRFKDMRELGRELLLLAGQRTRITWGLSFGELPSGPETAKLGSVPPVGGSVPPPAPAAKRATPWLLVAFALVILLLFVMRVPRTEPDPPPSAAAAPLHAGLPVPSETARPAAPIELTPEAPLPPASAQASNSVPRRRTGSSRARSTASDGAPEWALPGTSSPSVQARSGEGKPASGTNGAPIFD